MCKAEVGKGKEWECKRVRNGVKKKGREGRRGECKSARGEREWGERNGKKGTT